MIPRKIRKNLVRNMYAPHGLRLGFQVLHNNWSILDTGFIIIIPNTITKGQLISECLKFSKFATKN